VYFVNFLKSAKKLLQACLKKNFCPEKSSFKIVYKTSVIQLHENNTIFSGKQGITELTENEKII